MKILPRLGLLALAYFTIPLFASAQIAPSGIFREQPTPTPQPSPAETPAATATPVAETPPPAKSEKHAEPAEKKPTPNKPKASPVADDDERPSGTGSGTVFKLRQMEREWEASPHNTAIIQKMVADDFIGVTSEGKIITKKAMLKDSNEKQAEISSSVGHMDVRLYGPKLAVVVGTAKQSTKDKEGKKSTTSYRFTDTWMERGGNWECIAGQATALPKSSDHGTFLPSEFQTGSHLPRRKY